MKNFEKIKQEVNKEDGCKRLAKLACRFITDELGSCDPCPFSDLCSVEHNGVFQFLNQDASIE